MMTRPEAEARYDAMASMIIRVLQENGLRVPEDVLVMGSSSNLLFKRICG